jgi:hypothetical protein
MDHGRPVCSVEDDELQQVAGPVRSDGEVAQRVVANLLDDERMAMAWSISGAVTSWRYADGRISTRQYRST